MAPGVDTERAPADKAADGLGVIDPVARKLIDRWHVGSDPEQLAISKDGKSAFIANEDDASASIVDLSSGQSRGKVKVSEEPEGVGEVAQLFPKPMLGVLLLVEGVAMLALLKDLAATPRDFALALCLGVIAAGLPYGYLVALVLGTLLYKVGARVAT